ncbi:MAG: hypothetical protein GF398_02095 [Chitinivibrionales bacterium]|nr:hypothetical protein [Chitinivibrionales bacterium]
MRMHILPFLTILLISCTGRTSIGAGYVKRFYRMDTITNITLIVNDQQRDMPHVWRQIDSILVYWERRFSQTHTESEVLRVNERDGDTVNVSPEMAAIVGTGLDYADTTGGRFNITILPLKRLWGFGEQQEHQQVPTREAIAATLEKVNYRSVTVVPDENRLVFAHDSTRVDVGGLAKGFVVREIVQLLQREGINNYLIEAGGDIAAHGARQDGNAWKIGIRHPRSNEQLLAAVRLDSGCVVTSGDYERYWINDGTRYHHIMDPATGYPCTGNQSLTLYGEDPVETDILSTGLFCMQADAILDFVNRRPRLKCIIVDSSGQVYTSTRWQEHVTFY